MAQGIHTFRVYDTRLWQLACRYWVAATADGRDLGRVFTWAARAARYATLRRTWQAEWDGCERPARAFTRRGAIRKARKERMLETLRKAGV